MNFSKLNILVFVAFFFLGGFLSFAQLDDPSKKNEIKVPLEDVQPDIEVEKAEFNDPRKTDDSGIEDAIDKMLAKMQKEQDKSNLKNKGITTAADLRAQRAQQKVNEVNRKYPKIDQYLGGFSTLSDRVVIVCRDFQYPDGDTVTIYVNEQPVIRNIVLTTGWQKFALPLQDGLNVISFKALNQGTSGPNTAAFVVFDDQAQVISSNEWNLATGAKATLTIAKVDEDEE